MIYLTSAVEAIPQTSQLTIKALCFTGGIGLLAGNIFGKIILDQERTTSGKIFPAVITIAAAGISALMIGGLIGLVTTAAFFALGFCARRFNTTEQSSTKNAVGEERSEALRQLKQETLDLAHLKKEKQGLLEQLKKTNKALEEANQEKEAALQDVPRVRVTERSDSSLKTEERLRAERDAANQSIASLSEQLKNANKENQKATATVNSLQDKIAEQTIDIDDQRRYVQMFKRQVETLKHNWQESNKLYCEEAKKTGALMDKVDNLNRDCKALDKMLSEEAEKTSKMTLQVSMNEVYERDYPKLEVRATAAEAKVVELETKVAELQAELIKAQSPA